MSIFSISYSVSWVPLAVDNVLSVPSWIRFSQVKIQLLVTWQVAVVSVVYILGNSEDEWIIELIKFVMIQFDVVFNTITIQVGDSSSMPSLLVLLSFSLQEGKILWSLNIVDKHSESFLVLSHDILIIAHVV